MHPILRQVFAVDQPLPNVPLVFLTTSAVALLQFPASLLIGRHVSLGILLNEVVIVACVPLLLIHLRRFDRGRLLPFRSIALSILLPVVLLTVASDVIIDYATAASEHFFPLPESYRAALENIMRVDSAGSFVWKLI